MTIDNTSDEHIIEPEDQAWLQRQIDNLTFGSVLRAWRLSEGWSSEQTAQQLGVSKQMLSQWETGKRLPSARKAVEIAETLGMSVRGTLLILMNQQLRQANVPYRVEKLAS